VGFLVSLLPIFYSAAAVQTRGIRYCMASVGFGGLLAAFAALRLRPEGVPGRRVHAALLAAALLHLALCAATVSNNFASSSGAASTNRRAGAWLEENVKPGESVGLWILPRPENSPYFRLDRISITLLDPRETDKFREDQLPRWIVLWQPKANLRPEMERVLARYERFRSFEPPSLVPWIRLNHGETSANPVFEVYRKKL
jgi:hypothetical protein